MTKTQRINFILAATISIYSLIIAILAIKQHFEIKSLENTNTQNQTAIANLKRELDTPEYKAADKCKNQGMWIAKCIEWELGVNVK